MAYVSLYRKYRSQTFGDLIGQEHVVRTLQNGIASGRISHSYLFTGPRGTGKTSSARLLAKCLCCEKGPLAEPCNECEICLSITDGSCIDVVEMDAASQTGIDEVREKIIQATEYMPARCRYKVFVIDEVHDLSAKAFDALLKTIEEPPSHIVFVLATTEYNKVPPTIRSRCQKFEFHRASMQDLVARLEYVAKAEGVEAEGPALYAIARMADGGFRDALTLLEQAIISSDGKITLQDVYDQLGLVPEDVTDKIFDFVVAGDIAGLTELLTELARIGRDPRMILESMLYRLADLTHIMYRVEQGGDPAHLAAGHALAVRIGAERLLELRSSLAEAHKVIRDISLPRLWLESELIRLALPKVAPKTAEAPKPRPQTAAVQQPANLQEARATNTQETRPAPTKEETSTPHPAADAAEPGEPIGDLPAPEPSGNEELDTGRMLWYRTLTGIPRRAAIYLKLHDSQVVAMDGDILHVAVPQKLIYDWLHDAKKGRLSYIHEEVQKNAGRKMLIEFRVQKNGTRNNEPVAVELPAEGQKLIQMAREVLGSIGHNSKDEVT